MPPARIGCPTRQQQCNQACDACCTYHVSINGTKFPPSPPTPEVWGGVYRGLRGGGGGVSGILYLDDPPEAPAQPEGDPKNVGLPTATRRLTRSRQGGPKRAAHASTPRHQGLAPAGFSGGGGGLRFFWGRAGYPPRRGWLVSWGHQARHDGSMKCHRFTPCPNMFHLKKISV